MSMKHHMQRKALNARDGMKLRPMSKTVKILSTKVSQYTCLLVNKLQIQF